MSVSRWKTVGTALTALLVMTAAFVLARSAGASGQGAEAFKLEGVWIARVTSPAFPVRPQWTYVLTPDPSGRRASLFGSTDLGFGVPGVRDTPLLGEIVQTSPDTAAFNVIWHRISVEHQTIVAIGTVSGTATFLAPGKVQAVHHFAIYDPAADADGDGLPDPDTNVVPSRFTVTTMDTRVPSPVQ